MIEQYTCCLCRKTYAINPDWDAKAELAQTFPGRSTADCDVVCDDCFQELCRADPDLAERAGQPS